jgi:hypothetical protein
MTRLQVFSDLHADVRPPKAIKIGPDVDAVVVAGDVCEGAERGFAYLRQIVPMSIALVMVFGPTVLRLEQRDDADHIEAWEAEKERESPAFFLLTLAEDRAETASPSARLGAPRRPQPGGLR